MPNWDEDRHDLLGTGNSTGQGREVGMTLVLVREQGAFSLVDLKAAQKSEVGRVVVKPRLK